MDTLSPQEVILNGDSSVPTRVIEGVLQLVAPTTAEQSVYVVCAKLPIDVDDLKEIDLRWQMTMLTMWAIRFLQKTGRNLGANGPTFMGFDMSKVKCYNCHRKRHVARECRSPKDLKRTGAVKPQRRTVPVETSTLNALVSQCNGRGSYDWSYQAEEEPANYALIAFSSSSSSSNNEVLSCSKACSKAYAQLHTQYDKLTNEFRKSQFDVISYQIESDCESWPPSSLYDRFQPRGGYHAVPPPYTGTFMPLKPNLVFNTAPTAIETDHLAFNVQLSPTKPEQDLSHTTKSIAPIIEDWVSDSENESETKAPHLKSTSSGKGRNKKACFVCKSVDHLIKDCDYHTKKMAQPTLRNYAHRGNRKQYASLTHTNPQKHMILTSVLTKSKPVFNTAIRPVRAALPTINVTQPKCAHPIVNKSKSPIRRHITCSPSQKTSNLCSRVTAVKALVVSAAQGMQEKWGNPQHALQDKRVINSGYSRNMTGNMSYLSDFKELNGGYVAFGGNPKGGKIFGKEKIKTVNTACYVQNRMLVTKPHNKTPYELLHGKTPSIGFMRPFGCLVTILNTLDSLGKFKGKVDEGFLVGYSINSKAFRVFNSRTHIVQETLHVNFLENKPNVADAVFDEKEHDAKKPESKVNVFPSNSAQSRKQDDKTKKEAKGKSPVESFTGYRDLKVEFEDCSNNSSNEVNAVGSIVPIVGQNSLNNTNTFSTAGPSNAVVSPTYGKSSFIDASQLPDDPDMPELEDISYTDEEDVVGTEADFNNLESSILVSPIPTTRIHKDHSLSQIIGDLSSTTQTKEEHKRVKQKKDEIFISQDKYVAEILRKFGLTEGKSASTPIDTKKPLLKDPDGKDVDVHTYMSMIGSLMYLTSSRPDIMFACKKQTVVATSSTKAEYVAAASCCAQVLWIQNQLLDYGWLVQKQTALGQTTTGKEISNPFMAGSLPKTIMTTFIHDNDVTRLQALVDKKKVVVTKAAIREVLRLDDAEGVDCLPNEEIFVELARMGYEKPSTKLTFYKDFFLTQWKFLIQTILQSMSAKRTSWNEFSLAMTSVFANMRRVGKGFSRVETPLFEGMLVGQVIKEGGDKEEHVEDDIVAQRDDALKPSIPSPTLATPPLRPPKDVPSTSQLKRRVKKLGKGNMVRVLKLQRLKRVGTSQRVDTSEDTMMDDASNQGRIIDEMDKDDAVTLMDDKEEDKKEEEAKEVVDVVTTAKLITEVVTAACEIVATASTIISTAEPQVPATTITTAPSKTKEQMEEEKSRALKTINETPAQKAAKRRKLNKEVEDLKRHLEIVPDEDDDVHTKSIPLARKFPVVDYEIIHLNNKPHYKIIQADGTHQLFVSFLTLLKNFDREDLEALWSLVKERFSTLKPKNFSDDFLRTTLGAMFEKPDRQAQV
uniref:Retrovirus-related Pol polyprotein from transposon TNT 1-94 n=1 Tax=Tanacetum cinerariifolium TaxID=118510 RepID=A0A699GHN6_TANCI|nr:retrovirus-related Pol polyprotein from transposon TNT 1-94 [Tanacetum cinerariifolium]